MEFALGAAYDQLKRPKDAIAAYQRAVDLEPGDPRTMDALAQALLNDNQLDEALKQYQDMAEADPDNSSTLVHIAEIQRRQGKYEDALATIRKARKMDPTSLEAGYNEGLLLDVLGRYDEAAQTYSSTWSTSPRTPTAPTPRGEEQSRHLPRTPRRRLSRAEQGRPGHRRLSEDD